jgi:hypothetical protein
MDALGYVAGGVSAVCIVMILDVLGTSVDVTPDADAHGTGAESRGR